MKKTLKMLTAAALLSTASLSVTATKAHAFEPFIGQMMTVGSNFCPRGWSLANGQILAISSHTALFSLLGTAYGGDGRSTFGLPDLRSRTAVHVGRGAGLPNIRWGEKAGNTQIIIASQNMPSHHHGMRAIAEDADASNPNGAALAGGTFYSTETLDATLSANSVTNTGGNQPIQKRSPMLGQYWCIAMVGIYPSRS